MGGGQGVKVMIEELMKTHGYGPTVRKPPWDQPGLSACMCQVCSLVSKSPSS